MNSSPAMSGSAERLVEALEAVSGYPEGISVTEASRALNISKAAFMGCHGVEVRRYLTTNFDALKLAAEVYREGGLRLSGGGVGAAAQQ